MTVWLILAVGVVTVMAAVRSTWSPCGLSMLASITPLSESGRGHRYRTTAWWFVVGSTMGGATLGVMVALLTVAVDAFSLTSGEVIIVALVASALALASDADLGGFHLPVHHRQVNERWLDRFRPWVYGAGFGWQIGSGLATYIMTAGVYLLIVLAALTGEPLLGLVFGALFGLVRGLSVFLGRRITSTERLRAFHVRFYEFGPTVRRLMVAVDALATALFAWLLSPWAGSVLVATSCGWMLTWVARRRTRTYPTVVTAGTVRERAHAVSGNERVPDDG
jgi:hypothetical protein